MTESKSAGAKEVWITGIGIVSSLGEGLDAHWDALDAKKVNIDDKRFAPYIVHPLAPVTFDAQIVDGVALRLDRVARNVAGFRDNVGDLIECGRHH